MAHTLLSLTPWWQLLVTIARLLFVSVRPFLTQLPIFCLSLQGYFWPQLRIFPSAAISGARCAAVQATFYGFDVSL